VTDTVSKGRRSWNMSRIKSGDTKPELFVRSLLHRHGFRFRLHVKNLPGKPDIVLPKYHAVIFVHGCFWHRHPGCKNASTPKQNAVFWQEKFRTNVARDKQVLAQLRELGWHTHVIWECECGEVTERIMKIMRFPEKFIERTAPAYSQRHLP